MTFKYFHSKGWISRISGSCYGRWLRPILLSLFSPQLFDCVSEAELLLRNTGKVDFEFSVLQDQEGMTPSHLQPGLPLVLPNKVRKLLGTFIFYLFVGLLLFPCVFDWPSCFFHFLCVKGLCQDKRAAEAVPLLPARDTWGFSQSLPAAGVLLRTRDSHSERRGHLSQDLPWPAQKPE